MLIVSVLMQAYFGRSLTRKCASVNNHQWMIRSMFIDLNLGELYYYPFVISINKCNDSCNIAEVPFQFVIFNPWKVSIAFSQNSFVVSPGLLYPLIRPDS